MSNREIQFGNFGLGTLVWDFQLSNFSLGTFAWELWFGIFRLGSFLLGSFAWGAWAWEAGGTSRRVKGEPAWPGSFARVLKR